jgi:hypothetical protein
LSARCVLICLHQKISADILTFHKTSQWICVRISISTICF